MKTIRALTRTLLIAGVVTATAHAADGYLTDNRDQLVRAHEEATRHAVVTMAPPMPETATPDPTQQTVAVTKHEHTTLEVDPLFSFDRAELRPLGRKWLDELAMDILSASDVQSIHIVGHADRFGDLAYNQRLSEKRAKAVKAYLVARGVKSEWIHTEGKGEAEPVAGTAACPGNKLTAFLRSCLQPDRRVEVDVFVTRQASSQPTLGSATQLNGASDE